MDLIGLIGASGKCYKYVMTIIDVFTRYLITVPLRSKKARELAKAIYVPADCIHSAPQTITTDHGIEFVNHVATVGSSEGTPHALWLNYCHPAANGIIERASYIITIILRTMVEENISIWDLMLLGVTLA